jgi:multidrug efflux pump
MQVFGFSINLLTLLAIVLAVGLVVDDAIVMVENVERHLGMGKPPLEAALVGARELVGPIIATTVVLAAVYAPIGIQGGLTGSLFREFAFTLTGAVIISTVVALTLSPMMSSKLLAPGMSERGLAGKITRDFKRLSAFYGRLLDAHSNRGRRSIRSGSAGSGHRSPFHDVTQGVGANRRPGRHLRHRGCGRQCHPGSDQPLMPRRPTASS